MKIFYNWIKQRLADPQIAVLVGVLLVGAFLVLWIGNILAPIFAAVIIAYLLEGLIRLVQPYVKSRMIAVLLVYFPFLILFLLALLVFLPMLFRQVTMFLQQLPSILTWIKNELTALPDRFPDLVSIDFITQNINMLQTTMAEYSQRILTFSLASLSTLLNFLVYLIIVPLMVFFMLKDKHAILAWFARFIPSNNRLVVAVWRDLDRQIGNYIRGKFIEIIIVWGATSIIFSLLRLQSAVLFGLFVGLSVLIPYVGAAAMTFPIAMMAYYQWQFSAEFFYVMAAYGVIQLVDGNILATFLFADAVNLHPLAILVAVVVAGGMWGFWGVFFAIPLATMIESVLQAWSGRDVETVEDGDTGSTTNSGDKT